MPKILVTEDDLALSAGLCFELDTSGYITVAAYNCRKSLKLLEEGGFDLALMDVNLPDGSGFDLCVRAKEMQPGLPVIFLTANAGNVVTRQLLLEKLWDCDGSFIDDHTLTVTMNRLRAKIEDKTHPRIKTVRGMGYIWTGASI